MSWCVKFTRQASCGLVEMLGVPCTVLLLALKIWPYLIRQHINGKNRVGFKFSKEKMTFQLTETLRKLRKDSRMDRHSLLHYH